MVAHFTMRTYGVNQVLGFVEGIWLHRQIRFFFGKDLFYFIRAQHVLNYHLISEAWFSVSLVKSGITDIPEYFCISAAQHELRA